MPYKNLERLSSSEINKTIPLDMGMRERIKMNSDWRFYPGEREEEPTSFDFKDDSWEQVRLPHDFTIERSSGVASKDDPNFLNLKSGWYRKTFDIPHSDKGKNLWIDFEGICGKSVFWFNGKSLGNCSSGYTGIYFDITDLVHYGKKNNITIRVDTEAESGEYCEGGGIYRSVWLNKSDCLRVAHRGVFVSAAIADGEAAPVEAEVEIRTKVLNGFQNALSFTILSQIQDAQGNTVRSFSNRYTIGIDTFVEAVQKVKLTAPILWSLENPHLYRLIIQLEREGEIVDGVTTPFGIRSIRFDEQNRFFLNGKPIKIKGTCNHEDFAGLGIALPERIVSYKLEKLIESGSNAYKSSGYPPSIELLNECDRLGLLVIDEQPRYGESEEVISQLESMILRDRNHPCVILWSLCNDKPKLETEDTRRIVEMMRDLIFKHDPTRPIVCAISIEKTGLTKIIDVQEIDANTSQYDSFHEAYPHSPLYGSKIVNVPGTRGIYANAEEKDCLNTRGSDRFKLGDHIESQWKAVMEKSFILGGFVWTGFDYREKAFAVKKGDRNFRSGFMDVCGFPKDIYYYYQSWWSDKKILHLFPHWNWQAKEGREIDVRCYSNCESVELLLNEKSQGIQKMPRNGHLEWKVKYHSGSLRAIGTESGKVIIETVIETASAPVKVRLKPHRSEMAADGEDVIPVEVEILDWKNRLVPLAYNEVVFDVKGPGRIACIENGDPDNYESNKLNKRKTFNGRCLVLVQSIEKSGEIKMTAKSPGLRHGSVILKSF